MPTRKCKFCNDRKTLICQIEVMGAGGPCPFDPFDYNKDNLDCQFYAQDQRSGKKFEITPDMIKSRRMIPVENIVITGLNPRKTFDKTKQKEMDITTKEIGIQHSLGFRPNKDDPTKLDLADGEYRYRSAINNKFKEVPGFVQHLTDAEVLLIMIAANSARDDVSPLEEAEGIKKALDMGISQTQLKNTIGKSQPWISNAIRLLKCPEDLQDLLLMKMITPKHAMIILPFVGYKIYDKIVEELMDDIEKEGKVSVEELKINIENVLETSFDIPEEIGVLNIDDFGHDVTVDGTPISKPILDRHFDDKECEKCKIPKKIEDVSGSQERHCLDYDCWKVKALAALKAHQDEEAAVLEAEKKKADKKAGKKQITVISPNSHVWAELKRPKKGTVCEICGATENLMAYRGPYNSQTICKTHLKKAQRDGLKAGTIIPERTDGKKPTAAQLLEKKKNEERIAKEEEKAAKEQDQKMKEAAARQLKRNQKDRIKAEEEACIKAMDDYLKDVQKEFKFLDDLSEDHIKSRAMKSLLIHLVNNLWSEPNKRCYRKWDPACNDTRDAIDIVKTLKGSERIVAALRGLFYQECNPAGTVITNYALLKKNFPQAAPYYSDPRENPTPPVPAKVTKVMIKENKGPHNHNFTKASLVTEKGGFDWMECSKCKRREKRFGFGQDFDPRSPGCWYPDVK